MDYHFLSGLPRSGSTLLAAILRQNPVFHASIMSPVGQIITKVTEGMGPSNEAAGFLGQDTRLRILRGVFEKYYAQDFMEYHPVQVVFDNNRRWCANAALLQALFPGSKIICCVRPPTDIVDSFERLFRAHPTYLSLIYGALANTSVYERTVELMRPAGALGFALAAFRDAFFGPHHENLLVVEYEHLCQHPKEILTQLHKALDYPPFAYKFDDIAQIPGATDFDERIGTPGLHNVKSKIVYETRPSCLPPDICERLPDAFWRGPPPGAG